MEREKAKEYLKYIPHFDGDKFIDEIYNDIESRTCENCRWYQIMDSTNLKICKLYDIHGIKDFGCNKWVVK